MFRKMGIKIPVWLFFASVGESSYFIEPLFSALLFFIIIYFIIAVFHLPHLPPLKKFYRTVVYLDLILVHIIDFIFKLAFL